MVWKAQSSLRETQRRIRKGSGDINTADSRASQPPANGCRNRLRRSLTSSPTSSSFASSPSATQPFPKLIRFRPILLVSICNSISWWQSSQLRVESPLQAGQTAAEGTSPRTSRATSRFKRGRAGPCAVAVAAPDTAYKYAPLLLCARCRS